MQNEFNLDCILKEHFFLDTANELPVLYFNDNFQAKTKINTSEYDYSNSSNLLICF